MHFVRRYAPWAMIGLLGLAFFWAISFDKPERADFVFNNITEVQTLDPPEASGQPEGRVIDALFEGLCRDAAADDPLLAGFVTVDGRPQPPPAETPPGPAEGDAAVPGNAAAGGAVAREKVDLVPGPGMADHVDISEDGLTYRFRIREDARWSDGTPLTAEDFVFSWWRLLHPETVEKYSFLLYYVEGAEAYANQVLTPGGPVEVELVDRRDELYNVPRGTILGGTLVSVHRDAAADAIAARMRQFADEQVWERFLASDPSTLNDVERTIRARYRRNTLDRAKSFAQEAAQDAAVAVVAHPDDPRVTPARGREADAAGHRGRIGGKSVAWTRNPALAAAHYDGPTERCQRVMPDFERTVALKAPDPRTLELTLTSRTPFFLSLVAFYPLMPTPRHTIERHGVADWTRQEHIVTNGPYRLLSRRLRDRISLVRSDEYWDREQVAVERVDVLAVDSATTALNMYFKGDLDWIPTIPPNLVTQIRPRQDFYSAPMLTVAFYRFNCTKAPTNDPRVRRALNMAVDKTLICEQITKAGERPATHLVPDGMAGYTSPEGPPQDVREAKRLIDEVRAEFTARGESFPTIEILFNNDETHELIAESIMRQWTVGLGVPVSLRRMEWSSYLPAMHNLDYTVCRAGWIGDYNDPNTFLDMWVTGGGNNETGWSNPAYDKLIADAQREGDPARRLTILAEAEALLLTEMPVLPIYFYMSKNMVNPRIGGFFTTIQDMHPLHKLRIEGPPAPPDELLKSRPAAMIP